MELAIDDVSLPTHATIQLACRFSHETFFAPWDSQPYLWLKLLKTEYAVYPPTLNWECSSWNIWNWAEAAGLGVSHFQTVGHMQSTTIQVVKEEETQKILDAYVTATFPGDVIPKGMYHRKQHPTATGM